ncbi:MAG TPA: GNAT family protein [Humibacillus sp.]|nr:GNAT family protein [Humibacillus sp.]
MHPYAPLTVIVTTPLVELRGATDDLLGELAPLVRAGQADADPPPFDDPMSLYEADPDTRVEKWLRAVWRSRGRVDADFWRLNLVVLVDGQPVGMQDVIGADFDTFGTVTTFSWLAADVRGRGLGREMREAALHLAFDGFGAVEAASDAFVDNVGSNRVSESLGYERNGTDWDTRRGDPALIQRWRITREQWLPRRRDDITVSGVEACRQAFRAPSSTGAARPPTAGSAAPPPLTRIALPPAPTST